MADSKQLRQFAALQVPAPAVMRGKRPEDLDDRGQDAEQAVTEAQDGPAADAMSSKAAASEPSQTVRVDPEATVGIEGGPSAALIGAGALGLAVAVAGGGGGKSGDFKPPVIGILDPDVPPPKPERPTPTPTPEEPRPDQPKPEQPKPEQPKPEQPKPEQPKPEQPKPEQPKPGDQKPQEPAPNPEGQTKPDQASNADGNPETPTNPSGPSPEEQKPNPETVVPPVKSSAPTAALVNDTGNFWKQTKSDGITSDATLRVSGISEGFSWRYSIDGGEWRVGASDGYIAPAEFDGKNGVRRVHLQQIDPAGIDGETRIFEFELDTQAPDKLQPDRAPALDEASFITGSSVGTVSYGFEGMASFSLDGGKTWVDEILRSDAVVGNNGPRTALVRQIDAAGNIGEANEFQFLLMTSGPSITLKSDAGVSSTDGITNISTLTIGDLAAGTSWKYSLDGGATWKAGSATNEIAASEFGFDEGVKSVKAQQFTTDGSEPFPNGSESAIRTYEFTFQRQTVEANLGYAGFITQGTEGADRFVVKAGEKGGTDLEGYSASQGDVIDLRGLFQVEAGKQLSDYLKPGQGSAGARPLYISYTGELGATDFALNSDVRLTVLSPVREPFTILYSGGTVVL